MKARRVHERDRHGRWPELRERFLQAAVAQRDGGHVVGHLDEAEARGSATPWHQHDCEEVVLVLEGSGEVRLDGRAHRFGPDTTLVIPPRVVHQIVNSGIAPLVTVAAFSATPVGTFEPDGERMELPWAS